MSTDLVTLLNIVEAICKDNLSEKKIRSNIDFYNTVMRNLKSISSENNILFRELNKNEYVNNHIFQKKFLLIEAVIEKVSAEQYLSNGKDSILKEKLIRHTPLMQKDGQYLGLSNKSKVLLIGSGAIPITGIILCKKFHCKITCLDMDEEAIELSKKVVTDMGLIKYFDFLCCNIRDLDLSDRNDTTGIIVAYLPNKNEILLNFFEHSHNIEMLIRQPRGPYSLVYDKVDKQLINKLKNIKIDDSLCRGHYSSIIGRIE